MPFRPQHAAFLAAPPARAFARALACSALACTLLACGGDEGDDGTDPGPDDGRLHPPSNGVHITEADACSALLDAYTAQLDALGCTITTTRTCPDLIRAMVNGTTCLEFDEGSVNGCIAHYGEQADCQTLASSLNYCAANAYAGTTSAGCTR
ncbi:hypothetical protein [Chondromyces apiculatus]|nr:hypothetical protein [Chondromyces apiculatus]